jgi:hypothetical protein
VDAEIFIELLQVELDASFFGRAWANRYRFLHLPIRVVDLFKS